MSVVCHLLCAVGGYAVGTVVGVLVGVQVDQIDVRRQGPIRNETEQTRGEEKCLMR